MKKIVLLYGLLAGIICSISFVIITSQEDMNTINGMIYGFTAMFLAFSLIFVGTTQYRKNNNGTITFGKAFLVGLYISLIASTFYVIAWLITLYNFHPDFADKYANCIIDQMKTAGAAQSAIDAKVTEMNEFKEAYKNPAYVIATTYMEILPLGIIVSLISATVSYISTLIRNKKQAIRNHNQ